MIVGPQGSGKGTQAEVLKDKYKLVHISTGDVFRFNIKNETEVTPFETVRRFAFLLTKKEHEKNNEK